ncbi:MAG: bifunctional demethylmenaquinone methyltransferase/2-methoxy-6-polyprenyl-1,4-benzoquinol methylase UbiE [Bacteroidota bacterium]
MGKSQNPIIDKSTSSVAAMFNSIAPSYDFLNHLLSLGIDKIWRRRLVKRLLRANPQNVLDVATGTADLALALAKRSPAVKVVGIDISESMLAIGMVKVKKRKLADRIALKKASALSIPYADDHFNAAMVAFGVRNFEDLSQGLKEICRVLKPGGELAVLEFSMPRHWPFNALYRFYFLKFLPWIGGKVSGNRLAYTYLPESVLTFPQGETFAQILKSCGFDGVEIRVQTLGIATLYIAKKINQ